MRLVHGVSLTVNMVLALYEGRRSLCQKAAFDLRAEGLADEHRGLPRLGQGFVIDVQTFGPAVLGKPREGFAQPMIKGRLQRGHVQTQGVQLMFSAFEAIQVRGHMTSLSEPARGSREPVLTGDMNGVGLGW